MTKNINHIEDLPEFTSELSEVISGTRIEWTKTSEEIWPELLAKIEERDSSVRKARTMYLKVIKYAAAAVVALLTGVTSVMFFYTKTIENPAGQQAEIIFPDNSIAEVSEQSSLRYKPLLWVFSRSVELDGEGFFEVQTGKKFEVVSARGKTEVLGTRFNVYARNDEYNVTCLSGKVKVTEFTYHNEVIITGGQKAILKPGGNFEINDKKDINTDIVNVSPDKSLKKETVLSSSAASEQEKAVEIKDKVEVEVKADNNLIRQTAAGEKTEKSNQGDPGKQKPAGVPDRAQNYVEEDAEPEKAPGPVETAGGNMDQEEKTQIQATEKSPVTDRFRASLTPDQISILEGTQMSNEEKRKAFLQSLSSEQKQLLKEQNEERSRQAEAGKKNAAEIENVKDQQKMQLREQLNESSGKENMEQQRQQSREYKEKSNSGGGNKPDPGNSGC